MDRVERNRDLMRGPPRNRAETGRITQAARVDLVRKYLAAPNLWPDGIDWGCQWYVGNKKYWDALASEPGTSWEVVDREVRPRIDGANTVEEVEARIRELGLRKPLTGTHPLITEPVTEALVTKRPEGVTVTVAEGPREEVQDRKAYRREWMRRKREQAKPTA